MAGRKFSNKVVVVTGAASGIGLAVAERFARAGATCALLDMDEARLKQCEGQFRRAGHRVMGLRCDVTRRADCEAAIQTVIDGFGGIDVLFNNAGITQRSAFTETRIEVYERVMAVNFFGALYCTKAAIHSLIQRRGLIISNESIAGVAPLLGRTGYAASKHAMHGLFTSLRSEIRDHGVHVMVVCPGFIKTHLQDRALGGDGTVTQYPQSRVGRQDTPERAAEAIFRGAQKEKDLLVLTTVGKIAYWISRLAPGFYERRMASRFKAELER
ncbi:SDR family oxidoreductase [Desulfosarcina sp.]|uniref:SDR family oxidoreductase n=1 Tax=Desulfosarcina sp. TaxID=2027861 RepID=UPI0029BD4770|nr:SDR family oxidoreductase [Desulfosarcina sp.]MDX2455564.1 SDR family oxidoreductase [Desulfosarcina sp.]MDX2493051.1 SDR family oxidoreductase [Desulfosarcina sp.]